MKILYFAWLRQKIGTGEETKDVPAEVATVQGLVEWLVGLEGGYADAFKDTSAIKVAINQEFADFGAAVCAGDEIAFFPPVTGG